MRRGRSGVPPAADGAGGNFDELYYSHHADIARFVARRMRDRSAIDEVVNDVFATAWKKQNDLIPGCERALLYKIARGHLANRYRKDDRRHRLQVVMDVTPEPADGSIDFAERASVLEALNRLTPDDREILLLYAWEGLGTADLAIVLDIRDEAAGARLRRARSRLERILTQLEGDHDA